jgi:DNA-binding GntR family transcriptional regulator
VAIAFNPVRNRTLREEVLEPLRKAILFGQLAGGQRLVEAEIAAQMGVSRVPVREALMQLEREGLVESFPHRGIVVAAVDEDEVDVLYELRAELEGRCLRVVMARDQRGLAERLTELLESMRAAAVAGEIVELAERDLAFHHAIVAGSGYRTLVRVWTSMDGPIRARLQRVLNAPGPERGQLVSYTAESHAPIAEAVARADLEGAVAALEHHIRETRRLIPAPP